MAIMKKLLILLLFIPYLGFSQIKVSALTEATSVGSSDLFLLVQSGTTKKVQFYRFAYNSDSVASQVSDSLVNYLAKKDSSDYITITRLNDSLLAYKWNEDSTARVVHDSLVNYGSPVSFGTNGQVPFMNVAGSDFDYSARLKWDDTTLTITDGNDNIFIGEYSGGTTTGGANVFLGSQTGFFNTDGATNTFIGSYSGGANTIGSSNVFTGYQAGYSNTLGGNNLFLGFRAGYSNTVGNFNLSVGNQAGYGNTGENNTFIGANSAYQTSTGNNNVFLGYSSGGNSTGSNNVFLGPYSGYNETGSNKLYIENSNSATPLIYGDFANDSLVINGLLNVTGGIISSGGGEIATEVVKSIYGTSSIEYADTSLILEAQGSNVLNRISIYPENVYFTDVTNTDTLMRLDFANDTVRINGFLKVSNAIHLFSYYGDSAISKSYTTAWAHLTNATNNMWIYSELDGFTVSNDTITVLESGDYDLKCTNTLDADNGETVSIRFYNVTQATGEPVAGAFTGRAANNFHTIVTESYAEFDAGDKLVVQYKGDASGTSVFKNGIIKIYLVHK